MSNSFRPHGLYSAWLLCPWNSPGKNTGVGSHFLLLCSNLKKKSLSEPHSCCGHQSTVGSKAAVQLVLWVENLCKLRRFLIPTFHIGHWTAISGKEMRVIPNLDPIIPPKPATKSMGFWSWFRAVRGWSMRQRQNSTQGYISKMAVLRSISAGEGMVWVFT